MAGARLAPAGVPRATAGAVVAAILIDLRAAESLGAVRQRYRERDGEWAHVVAARLGLSEQHRSDLRRIEDAAHGLRWLELAHGLRFDLRRSLVPQLPTGLFGQDAQGE